MLKAEAQNHQAKLTNAAQLVGQLWDVKTGEPVSWGREQVTWFDHALLVVKEHWAGTSASARRNTARDLTEIMLAMIDDTAKARRTRPDDAILRRALMNWAYRYGRLEAETPPPEIASALAWLAEHSRPVADLGTDEHIRTVLAKLATLQDGRKASASTMRTRRAILFQSVDLAVQRKLITVNLLVTIKTKRRHADDAVSPLLVPTLVQARRIIEAVRELPFYAHTAHRGPMLATFFYVMALAGLRPSEVLALTVGNCQLPLKGWGRLTLTGAAPDVGALWTDDGERHDKKGLKQRAKTAVRIVPIPPELVAILRRHLMAYPPAPDGRLFYDGPSHTYYRARVYQDVWRRARKAALSDAEHASQLARRPYDLRHFNASTLILAGVDTAQVARRLGHSIQVLLTVYAHWIDTGEDAANAKIEAVLNSQTLPIKALTSENADRGPYAGQMAQNAPIPA
ncbi:site-specific integrase [Nonomuraea sp. NPDC026600]|uniref:tyrosine-type recombinase/integrase n=1 Tax=Nonomuraea sp. NPDC026600 TaxID=3155363 RepID=UPI003410249A